MQFIDRSLRICDENIYSSNNILLTKQHSYREYPSPGLHKVPVSPLSPTYVFRLLYPQRPADIGIHSFVPSSTVLSL